MMDELMSIVGIYLSMAFENFEQMDFEEREENDVGDACTPLSTKERNIQNFTVDEDVTLVMECEECYI
jgi:hypothetical protein